MSGGGAGSSRFGLQSGETPIACEVLVIHTPLNSPDPAVIQTLKKDSKLSVVKGRTPGGIPRVEVITSQGQIAGSITPFHLIRLIECLDDGFEYIAVVTQDPAEGLVNLRIQAAQKGKL